MSLITGIIGGIQGASAAHNAANAVTNADKAAASTVTDAAAKGNAGIADATTAGQTGVAGATSTGVAGLNPYASSGSSAATTLNGALAPGGSLAQQFNPSTLASTPGYQFQLQQGEDALKQQQAATYAGNTQIQGGIAQGNGMLGAANSYNGMLSGIGSFANGIATGGVSNIGGSLGAIFGGGSGGGSGMYPGSFLAG